MREHFEIYADLASATRGSSALKTSQLAFPEDICVEAFMETGYEQSVTNLSMVSLASDMIFRDGVDQELATVTGTASAGYAASLTITP